jgi:hypothetical protein
MARYHPLVGTARLSLVLLVVSVALVCCSLLTDLDGLSPVVDASGADATDGGSDVSIDAAPTVVSSGETSPGYIVADDAFVYWTTSTHVRGAPVTGGPATTLAQIDASDMFMGLAIDATDVCWLTEYEAWCTPRGIPTTPRLVSAPTDVVFNVEGTTAYGTSNGLVSDGTTLFAVAYLMYHDADGIAVIPKSGWDAGTTPLLDTNDLHYADGISEDATNVYFADKLGVISAPKNVITYDRVHLDASFPPVLSPGGAATSTAFGAYGLFWTDYLAGLVDKLGPDGGVPIASGLASPLGIAMDATYVYWTTSDGTVGGCAMTGCNGAPIVLASGQGYPFYVAANGKWVFWTDNALGAVMKVPAP